MAAANRAVETLAAEDRVSNVLVAAPPHQQAATAACTSLLATHRPADLATIGVAVDRSADAWLEAVRGQLGSTPAHECVVSVGDRSRSAAPADGGPASAPGPEASLACLRTVPSPGNLTDLGVRITECLDVIEGLDGDPAVSLCFDSISPLLLYADVDAVFKFFTVLTGKLAAMDAAGHYHLDPAAHDDGTVRKLMTVFDAVVEPDGDGGLTVRTR